ncbi:hypothetical protein HDU98_003253, partial [Podochytrium sp. JEL0797]
CMNAPDSVTTPPFPSTTITADTITALCNSSTNKNPWTCAYNTCNPTDAATLTVALKNTSLLNQMTTWCIDIAYTSGGMVAVNKSLNGVASAMNQNTATVAISKNGGVGACLIHAWMLVIAVTAFFL